MSTPEIESVRSEALALPEVARAQLARDLVASLDGPEDSDVSRAWDIEICRRINEIENGTAQLLDPADVLNRARARILKN